MRIMPFLIFILIQIPVLADKKDVVYKFKKYESFDLGNLEIKGELIAPGDLTVRQRERKVFTRDLLNRIDFDRESLNDIKNLR